MSSGDVLSNLQAILYSEPALCMKKALTSCKDRPDASCHMNFLSIPSPQWFAISHYDCMPTKLQTDHRRGH